MIQLIIGFNVAIALLGFWAAWRLWKLRRTLVSATVTLDSLEQQAKLALAPEQAPAQLLQGRTAVVLTRARYRQLQQQLHQLQQVFKATVVILRLTRGPIVLSYRRRANR